MRWTEEGTGCKSTEEFELRLERTALKALFTFTQLARPALENRFGKNGALKLLASGIVWKTAANNEDWMYSTDADDVAWWQRHLLPDKYSAVEKYTQSINPAYQTLSKDWSHLGADLPKVRQLRQWARGKLITLGMSLMNESLFTTSAGYLGRAPTAVHALEPGDLLVVQAILDLYQTKSDSKGFSRTQEFNIPIIVLEQVCEMGQVTTRNRKAVETERRLCLGLNQESKLASS
ncbi:MAG: hypothetical protein Q9184_003092 [Pyrenodesmia sp. 2 TL-2023]